MATGAFISIEDLQRLRDALNIARNFAQVSDIREQILAQDEQIVYSKYTIIMAEAFERADGLFKQAAAEEYERKREEEDNEE